MSPSPLISVTRLADLLESGTPITLLDVRYRLGGPSGVEEFASGHIPGARFVDLDTELASAPAAPPGAGGRHPLPVPEAFGAAMRAAGVNSSVPVVVYDDWQARAAARAWWLLRHLGHPDARVLDGGWDAWRAAGGVVEVGNVEGLPGNAAGDFLPGPGQWPTVGPADIAQVPVLIDARNPERYLGEVEPVDPVAGHIPGAVNVPTGANLNDDGTFRSTAELTQTYAAVGAVPGADVAVYCGSGVTACHDVLALAAIGVEAALYPGSWSDWVSGPSRPVER